MDEKRVIARASVRPVRVRNSSGDLDEIGNVHSWTYVGEDVERHEYRVPYREPYGLRPTTGVQGIIEPFEVVDMVLNQGGWRLKDIHHGKGGLKSEIQFESTNRDSRIEDPVGWDRDLWNVPSKETGYLQDLLRIRLNSAPNGGCSVERGIYRLICENGMVGKMFGLGSFRMKEATFSNVYFREKMDDLFVNPLQSFEHINSGTGNGLHRYADLYRRHYNGEDISMPNVMLKQWNVIDGFPSWYAEHFLDTLTAAVVNIPQHQRINGLDIANLITNPISMEGRRPAEDRNHLFNATARVPNAVAALSDMVGILSL